MSKEAMELSKAFIEATAKYLPTAYDGVGLHVVKALEEALANHIPDDTKMVSGVKDSLITQQEQGEPVAWMDDEGIRVVTSKQKLGMPERPQKSFPNPLSYTTPPQGEARGLSQQQCPVIKPLTFEQIEDCFSAGCIWGVDGKHLGTTAQGLHDFARAIEAAHGIQSGTDVKE